MRTRRFRMNSREVALCGGLIALSWTVHRLMGFTEPIAGDIQFGIAISVYCLMPLLLRISLVEANVVGVATGLALTAATASPFPLANVPAHWAGLVSCKLAADRWRGDDGSLRPAAASAAVAVATAVSFSAFVLASYFGILSFPDLARGGGAVEAIVDGRLTFGSFVAASLLKAGVPTLASNAILAPIFYSLARSLLSRRKGGGKGPMSRGG